MQLDFLSSLAMLDPGFFLLLIATVAIGVGLAALIKSKTQPNELRKNKESSVKAELSPGKDNLELQKLNESLLQLAESHKANEERFQVILSAAADGIVVTGGHGIIEMCNRAACEIFGYSFQELYSHNICDFIGFWEEQTSTFHQVANFSFLGDRSESFEFAVLSKDKKIVPIELSISTSIIKNNLLNILVIRDISERKIAEKKLASLNAQLAATAHIAGMAEVATSVLHNVGNVLNSINVTVKLLLERDFESKVLGLVEFSKLINTHKGSLDAFIREHPMGQLLTDYLNEFSLFLKKEHQFLISELESLDSKVEHVKSIISMQQTHGNNSVIENVQINKLVDDSLAINSNILENEEIIIQKEYQNIPSIAINKVKLMQVLVNLIKNAIEALKGSKKTDKQLSLKTKIDEYNHIQIEISDNGVGVHPEDIEKIFSYGFTTKETGHGFGLHISALFVQEIGGLLKASSLGVNEGATFLILLPTDGCPLHQT